MRPEWEWGGWSVIRVGMGWLECDQSGNGVAGVGQEWEWGGWSVTRVGMGWLE